MTRRVPVPPARTLQRPPLCAPARIPAAAGNAFPTTMTEAPRPQALGMPTEPLVARKNDVLAEICRAIARSANHLDVVQECAVRLQRYFGTHSVTLFFERDGNLLML